MAGFDYSLDSENTDFREVPHLYRVGKGDQGVLLIEPYKSEILSRGRFSTEEVARESSAKIYEMFYEYREHDDFVGMDVARKYLQMGYTRARRYANHRSGKKYDENGGCVPRSPTPSTTRRPASSTRSTQRPARTSTTGDIGRNRPRGTDRASSSSPPASSLQHLQPDT